LGHRESCFAGINMYCAPFSTKRFVIKSARDETDCTKHLNREQFVSHMAVNERDLITFAILAGMWLRDRKPAVRKALRISGECGGYTSSPLFENSLRRLVRAGWLIIKKEKRSEIFEVNRYIPTLRGFSEFATTWEDAAIDRLAAAFTPPGDASSLIQYHDSFDTMKCLEKHVPVTRVIEIGRTLTLLVDVAAIRDLPQQYIDLARAVEEARPADEVDFTLVEQVVDQLPALQCILLDAKTSNIIGGLLTATTHACKRGLVSQLTNALKATLEAYLEQAQYCAHLGVQFDTKLAENILRNLATVTRCGAT